MTVLTEYPARQVRACRLGRLRYMSRIPKRLTRIREIILRAEQIVEDQRARVQQWQAVGNRHQANQASALLRLMEQVTAEFHAVRGLQQAHALRLKLSQIEGMESKAFPRSLPGPQPQPSSASCPHCGLETRRVRADDGSVTIEYDHTEWSKRCERQHLSSAALCQLPTYGFAGTVH